MVPINEGSSYQIALQAVDQLNLFDKQTGKNMKLYSSQEEFVATVVRALQNRQAQGGSAQNVQLKAILDKLEKQLLLEKSRPAMEVDIPHPAVENVLNERGQKRPLEDEEKEGEARVRKKQRPDSKENLVPELNKRGSAKLIPAAQAPAQESEIVTINGIAVNLSRCPQKTREFIQKHSTIFKEMMIRSGVEHILSSERIDVREGTPLLEIMRMMDKKGVLQPLEKSMGAREPADLDAFFSKALKLLAKEYGLWKALCQELESESSQPAKKGVQKGGANLADAALLTTMGPFLESRDIASLTQTSKEMKTKKPLLMMGRGDIFSKFLQNPARLNSLSQTQMQELKAIGITIKELDLSHNHAISDDLLRDIVELCPNLRKLKVGYDVGEYSRGAVVGVRFISDAGVQDIAKLKKLEELDLSYTQVTGKHFEDLSPKMRKLSVRGCHNFTDESVAKLANMKELEELDLSYTQVTGEHFEKLSPKMRTLSLDGCDNFTDESVAKLANMKELEELDLSRTQVTGEHFEKLSPKMRTLSLIFCENFTDENVAKLANMKELEELDLRLTQVTGEHFEKLSPKMRKLSVSRCDNFTDESVAKLANMKELEELDLSCTRVTGKHFEKLSPKMRELSLYFCHDVAAENLADLKERNVGLQVHRNVF
jgi:hypothetical protein